MKILSFSCQMDEIIERGNRSEIGQLLRLARRQKAAAKGAAGSNGKMDPDRLVQVGHSFTAKIPKILDFHRLNI